MSGVEVMAEVVGMLTDTTPPRRMPMVIGGKLVDDGGAAGASSAAKSAAAAATCVRMAAHTGHRDPWLELQARGPVEAATVNAYGDERHKRYGLGLGFRLPEPEVWDGLMLVVRRAMAASGTADPRTGAIAVFRRWFAKPGNKGFLVEVSHGLHHIGADLSDLAAAFERPAQAPPPPAEPRRERPTLPAAAAAGAAAEALALLMGGDR